MKKNNFMDQKGSVVHVLLIVFVVVTVAAIGLFAWKNMKKNANEVSGDLTSKLASAKCDYDDKDLCKFFTSYKEHKSYKMTLKNTPKAEGVESTSIIESEGTDKTHMTMNGDGISIETITIGKSTYTKATDGIWWKQTIKEDTPKQEQAPDITSTKLDEPTNNEPEAQKTQYKKVGKEACGKLECFKYQVIDPGAEDTTQFIWFDTKDYQIRKMVTENSGAKAEMEYSYENVKISEPSPVKELGPNQYLMPGQSEPTTLPTMPQ